VVAGVTQTIAIPGMTANGQVMLMYLHTNASGGAGQFFSNVVPGTNQVVVTLGQSGASTPLQEFIVWHVLKYF
jgi:sortase (surface protein transpeptidase)